MLYTENNFEVEDVNKIKIDKSFSELFAEREDIYEALLDNMKENGYREDKPPVLWRDILVEGHHRVRAAIDAGIKQIPVIRMEFKDKDEAIEFALREQLNRRNINTQEKIRLVELLYAKEQTLAKERQGVASNDADVCKASEAVGKKIHISTTAVERILRIIKSKDTNLIDKVANEELSISGACKLLKKKNASKKGSKKQSNNVVADENNEKRIKKADIQKELPINREILSVTKKEVKKLLTGISDHRIINITVEFKEHLINIKKECEKERKEQRRLKRCEKTIARQNMSLYL